MEQSRFQVTCYRAANWLHVGPTQGRGKLDRENRYALPVKDIFSVSSPQALQTPAVPYAVTDYETWVYRIGFFPELLWISADYSRIALGITPALAMRDR